MSENTYNPFHDSKMKQYFSSLPPLVQESILQCGVIFDTEDEMKQFVQNLNGSNA